MINSISNKFYEMTVSFEVERKKEGIRFRLIPTASGFYLEKYQDNKMISRTVVGFDDLKKLSLKDSEI